MTSSALDKVQWHKGTPPCMPGKCAVCGGSGDKDSEFLDIGLELDFYGVVYFCSICVFGDILKALDLVTQQKYDELSKEVESTSLELELMRAQNKELFSVLRSFGNLGIINTADNSNTEQSAVVEAVPENSGTAKTATSTKSRSSKQTNESRSTGVHNNDTPKEYDSKFDL
jgi:hypothetical protein